MTHVIALHQVDDVLSDITRVPGMVLRPVMALVGELP